MLSYALEFAQCKTTSITPQDIEMESPNASNCTEDDREKDEHRFVNVNKSFSQSQ